MHTPRIVRRDQMSQHESIVYLVDDRPADLMMVTRLCESVGIKTRIFENPLKFLAVVARSATGCLLVDLLMPDLSGLEVHAELQRRRVGLTTVVVTGFAEADSCRAAFRAGVFDYVQKDISAQEMLNVIRSALTRNRDDFERQMVREARNLRLAELTAREMDVAQLLGNGLALKEIGAQLSITVQTASKHRSSIFEKLAVQNEVELHQTLADCGVLSVAQTGPIWHHSHAMELLPQNAL